MTTNPPSTTNFSSPELDDLLPDHPGNDRGAREQRTYAITCELSSCSADERAALLDELVAINMPVAESIASRYRHRGLDGEDLCQVAYLALTKAAQRFDANSGYAFLAFCVPTIRGEIRRYFRDHGWVVRPPRRLQELQQRLSRAQAQLSARGGGAPSDRELAAAVGEDLAEVREALDCAGCFTPASLDLPVGESSTTIGDLFGEAETGMEAAEARVMLAPVVRSLSERDRHILRLRFLDGLTQREIADDIGVTQMQVSRLLSRIYRDLRAGLGELASGMTCSAELGKAG
jgi:RNA polymerase sigma-B factor